MTTANQEIIAELRRVLNERDEAREALDLTKRELGRWVDRETKTARERDSYQRQLDAIGDAIVTSITKRIEPRISRHRVSVVMAAGSLIAKIGEAIGCEFEDGDDLLEAVEELVRERDEARASVADAYRRGAEAMREACAAALLINGLVVSRERAAATVRALPIPEDK